MTDLPPEGPQAAAREEDARAVALSVVQPAPMTKGEVLVAWMHGASIASLPAGSEKLIREVVMVHARAIQGFLTGSHRLYTDAWKEHERIMENPTPLARQFQLGQCFMIGQSAEALFALRDWVVAAIEEGEVD